MPRKKHTPEQIITKLREAEVAMSTGSTVVEAVRQIELNVPLVVRREATTLEAGREILPTPACPSSRPPTWMTRPRKSAKPSRTPDP